MALVFDCPHCGGQNFVASERLGHRERPMVCWVCNREIPWEFLESLVQDQRTQKEKEENTEGGRA